MESPPRRSVKAWAIDLTLCAVYVYFATNVFRDWIATHKPLGLGLFVVNTTFAYLFIARRPARDCSKIPRDWLVTAITILLVFILRPVDNTAATLARVSVALQGVAVFAQFLAILSLGRSFGLVPANRGVKVSGVYAYVRHPLYASELLFYAVFVLGNPTWGNGVVLAGIVAGQILRARAEEALLSKDPAYEQYLQTVRCRFVPGLL